jgi:hypothetical protein
MSEIGIEQSADYHNGLHFGQNGTADLLISAFSSPSRHGRL